jgi:SAM-dependent methyltransferase
MTSFDELMAEGLAAPFTGWDFSWLDARSTTSPPPWNYRQQVSRYAAGVTTMLDMGTGGGEWLSGLHPRPVSTVATECWPPNVTVAARQLRPLGIPVVQAAAAPDNMATDRGREPDGALPFCDGAFGLVSNRHESFDAGEVARVLAPGGVFVTQQVDYHSSDDLYRMLGLAVPAEPDSWLPLALQQASSAGLTVQTAISGEEVQHFADLPGIVYYLKAIHDELGVLPPDSFRPALKRVFETDTAWSLPIRERRFLVVARKPA